MIQQKSKAFTLVELIIVITILAILATIGFLSYQSYTLDSRDGKRISELGTLRDSLIIYQTKNTILPLPDDYVTITSSGVDLSYQGNLGITVQKLLKTTSEIKDTTDNKYYTYTLNVNKKNFELLGFTEGSKTLGYNGINKVYADYTNRYTYTLGDKLGILVDTGTNLPIQEKKSLTFTGVDIVNTNEEYKVIFDENEYLLGTGIVLAAVSSRGGKSCKDILQKGGKNGDGTYWINPTGTGSFQVYCDMTTDGGGWTRISTYKSSIFTTIGFEVPDVQRMFFEYERNDSSVINRIALNEINVTASGGYILSSVAELGKLISLKLTGGPQRFGHITGGIWKSTRLTGDDQCIDDSKLNILPNGISWGSCGGTSTTPCTLIPGNILFRNGNNLTILSSNNNYSRCNGVDMSTPKKNKYTNVYVK